MARVIREQTKNYSLPDQVKVDTPEKEKRFLEEKTNQKRLEEKKKTKGDKFRESLKEVSKLKKGGRVKKKNTRRMNRLEELGRVDAEKAYTKKGKRNLKSEKKRIVRELKSKGGSAGAAIRGKGCEIR
tara:strand:+ start:75 stop:458 length:384 start_codon:yes stop_codon:yes gene_type:complete